MKRRRRRQQIAEMNVVPYIDVMLVLLVIFMVTAPMLKSGVEVDLPDSNASTLKTSDNNLPMNLSVDKEGNFYLDGSEALSKMELISLISDKIKQNKTPVLHVSADQGVEYSFVMQAMSAVRQAGVSQIGLVAAPKEAAK